MVRQPLGRLAGAPFGAAIEPTSGVFTWTPAEDQGPAAQPFTVSVTDGSPSSTRPVRITVPDQPVRC
jgi:hypothetical protein